MEHYHIALELKTVRSLPTFDITDWLDGKQHYQNMRLDYELRHQLITELKRRDRRRNKYGLNRTTR